MRIVTDLGEARRLLTRRPGFTEPELSPATAQRTATIFGEALTAGEAVRRILADVRARGDEAVREYAHRIDGSEIADLEIPPQRWATALEQIPAELRAALEAAAARVRAFHSACMPKPWSDPQQGYGERQVAIGRIGLYVPGGSAEYPSTVLMSAIPAKVAGVAEVILCTPAPSPAVLAAAQIAGVDRVFGIGGAQAIGAMAFGTQTVPRVDKICGPGNIFVSLAKQQVYGTVDIDGLYGPTETVVVADDSADPVLCAADLLAQAEHDEMASPVLIATSEAVALGVSAEVDRQLVELERKRIAESAMARQGVAVIVPNVDEAIALANAYAPEHLCLLVREAHTYVDSVTSAGGVFVGEASPEVIGDYVAGPSHVMPTGATARFASYLGVHHFLRHVPVVNLTEETLLRIGPVASKIARIEGLTAHAQAVERRLEGR